MDMFEEAEALRGLINLCKETQSGIAKKMGVSQSYVANKLRLLNFSQDIRKMITESNLSERHARTLLRLKDEQSIKAAIEKIHIMRLTVMESEALIDNMLTDIMVKKLSEYDGWQRIEKFEEILSAGIKSLALAGIKVLKKTDFYANKKHILLSIDEPRQDA